MCGICGILNIESEVSISSGQLKSMMRSIEHRGPDDDGLFQSESVGLGFRRLSIIDLSTGEQPIFSEDGTKLVICNGEIYNYKVLRTELQKCGHRFKTNSDVEVIVHGYEEYGQRVVKKLRGMFAFALWDENEKRLLIARDRLGQKPLYYALRKGRLIFASEIKAILASGEITPEVDKQTLAHYLTLMYSPGEMTLFKGISKLLPGHTLLVEDGDFKIDSYWDIPLDNVSKDGRCFNDYLEETESRLAAAVEARLISDVPLGAFLSGGIDSSIMVALIHKIMGPGLKTFSIGFEEQNYSELPYAKMVSQKFGTEHYELIVDPLKMLNYIPEAIWYRDEPLAYPAAVPLFLLSRFAAQHVKVVLSGEGGDELFAGYPKHVYDRFSTYYQYLPHVIRDHFLAKIAQSLPFRFRKAQIAARCLNIEPELQRLTDWFAAFDTKTKEALLSERFKDELELRTEVCYQPYRERMNGASTLTKQLYLDSKVWLPDNLLMKGDKMTMAASLEGRMPFLDHPFVEFAFTIPDNIKLKGLTTKHLLRKLAEKYLPSSLTSRRKVGFTVPIGLWFRNQLWEKLEQTVLSERALQRGYFRPEALHQICQQHRRGRFDFQRELWVLYNLEIWHRIFIDQSPIESTLKFDSGKNLF